MPDNKPNRDHGLSRLLNAVVYERSDMSVMLHHERQWRIAIAAGCTSIVDEYLRCGRLSPDTPVSDCGRSPLIDIAQMPLHSPQVERDLIEMTHSLLCHGARVNMLDYRGLYPADHAMVCESAGIAKTIVISTLRDNSTFNPGVYHKPNLETLFLTNPANGNRRSLYENFARNLAQVQDALKIGVQPSDRVRSWLAYTPPRLEDLPQAGPEILRLGLALDGLNFSLRQSQTGRNQRVVLEDHINHAQNRLRHLQTQAVHDYWERLKINRPEPSSPPPQP